MNYKACFKCGITKPLDDFYRHKMMADGYLNKCKECAKLDVRTNRAENVEYYRAYDKERLQDDPRRRNANKERQKTARWKALHAEANRRYKQKNPVAAKARDTANNAVRDGKLKRRPCIICGKTPAHKHHPDYFDPLYVVWLCPAHHKAIHKISEGKDD